VTSTDHPIGLMSVALFSLSLFVHFLPFFSEIVVKSVNRTKCHRHHRASRKFIRCVSHPYLIFVCSLNWNKKSLKLKISYLF